MMLMSGTHKFRYFVSQSNIAPVLLMKHLTSLGVLLAAAAIASYFHVLFTNPEKEAVYLLGH
jgi:hypothetical protein